MADEALARTEDKGGSVGLEGSLFDDASIVENEPFGIFNYRS